MAEGNKKKEQAEGREYVKENKVMKQETGKGKIRK
jgi:hypothetical protein